jgi:hypothetical protein
MRSPRAAEPSQFDTFRRELHIISRAWNRFWFAPGPASALGLSRLAFFGALSLWMLPRDFGPWQEQSSVFWMPIWFIDQLRLPALTADAMTWVQWIWKISLVLSAAGYLTRTSMGVAFFLGAYLLGLSQNIGHAQHFDTLIVFVMGALALSRAADACSVDALVAAASLRRAGPPPNSGEYTWPIRVVSVATVLICFAAIASKLWQADIAGALSENLALMLR